MEKIYNIQLFDSSNAIIKDNIEYKVLKSEKYNFIFNKKNGFFVRWGKGKYDKNVKFNKQELDLYVLWSNIWDEKIVPKQFLCDIKTDGDLSLGLPEIADIEISTSCHGVKGIGPCRFCYKSNLPTGDGNMTIQIFKKLLAKLPPTVGQIAFGITDIDANPDMWDIFEYTKSNGIVPNVTINGDRMTPELFDKLSTTMGAVAVSLYDKDLTYNAVKELTDRGMEQVNIHFMIAEQTFDNAIQLLKDYKTDKRLKRLNAIVFLSLKPKGRAIQSEYTRLNDDKFKELIDFAFENDVPIGFDSCSQPKFIKSIKNRKNFKELEKYAESCESSIYSLYINSGENGDPKFYPCSFSEKVKDDNIDWEKGISILDCDDFIKDIWFSYRVRQFANITFDNKTKGIACPMYNI
jgi:MoaA/NifB/PqqE/SkfB family radical SAM enzyme